MFKRFPFQNIFLGMIFCLALFPAQRASAQVASTMVGALFGTAYIASFDTKEIDFYYGQTFYNTQPGGFNSLDMNQTTFGSDITLYTQDFFNWFVGTERLGRTGSGGVNQGGKQYNLQWNIPVCALYTGTRIDVNEKSLLEPYFFCIGGLYSISDLLGNDALISNGSTYNVAGTALGLELGLGFTPLTFENLQISVEGNYRFANFPNVSYSPASSSLPALPTGLPTGIDYSGWTVQVSLSFEPSKNTTDNSEAKKDAARQKLLDGHVTYDKPTFMAAAENSDTYIVKLFLESGFKLSPDDLTAIAQDDKIDQEVKDEISKLTDKAETKRSDRAK